MENMLEVRGLQKQYRQFALRDISFTLPKGYIMGYVGQNGSGKTTTLNLISHLLKGDGGEVRLDGKTYHEDPIAYREKIGYVGDSSYFWQEFKIADVRAICKDFYPTFREDTFEEYIRKWKLPEKKRIKDFSRGMKVKLMFAAVLSRETKLLILDEATNGLDPVVREQILEILQDYIEDGEHSVLFSTHILSDLEQIADYIFFIENGQKVFFSAKDELMEEYVLVKGGLEDLDASTRKYLIGCKESHIGFEALAKSDDAVYLNKRCLLEKPSIDQMVTHYIREAKK